MQNPGLKAIKDIEKKLEKEMEEEEGQIDTNSKKKVTFESKDKGPVRRPNMLEAQK